MSIFISDYSESFAAELAGKGKFICVGQNVILHVAHLQTSILAGGALEHLIVPVGLGVQYLAHSILVVR